MTNTYYLMPIYDSRASFYNKAIVEDYGNNHKELKSYTTLCSKVENGVARVYDIRSQTTLRHVKEFLLQNGFRADNKKYIQSHYM